MERDSCGVTEAINLGAEIILSWFKLGRSEFHVSDLEHKLGELRGFAGCVISSQLDRGLIEEKLNQPPAGTPDYAMGFYYPTYRIRPTILGGSPVSDSSGDRWTVPMRVSVLKIKFNIPTKQRWTEFANKLREEGTLRDISGSGFREVSIHRSVFIRDGVEFPE